MYNLAIVSGGYGFIGWHLVKRLLQENMDVIIIDNKSNAECLQDQTWSDYAGYLYGIKQSLTTACALSGEPSKLDTLIYEKNYKPVYWFNLASPASPPAYKEQWLNTLEVNSTGVLAALAWCREHNTRFIQASTSEVYGDPLEQPQREEYFGNVNPIGPRSMYDEGKRFAEAACAAYKRAYNQDIVVARIFNTYGPGMRPDDGRVITNFIKQALSGEQLTIFGDGKQTRSFCYYSDLVWGLLSLAHCGLGKDKLVVNLGNPNTEITMLDLADLVLSLCGVCACERGKRITHLPMTQDDPYRRRPDIDRAVRFLAYSPVIDLERGLRATIDHAKASWGLSTK